MGGKSEIITMLVWLLVAAGDLTTLAVFIVVLGLFLLDVMVQSNVMS